MNPVKKLQEQVEVEEEMNVFEFEVTQSSHLGRWVLSRGIIG